MTFIQLQIIDMSIWKEFQKNSGQLYYGGQWEREAGNPAVSTTPHTSFTLLPSTFSFVRIRWQEGLSVGTDTR